MKIVKTIDLMNEDPDYVGETLLELFFVGEGRGCYFNFDLNPKCYGVEVVPVPFDKFLEMTCASLNVDWGEVRMRYFWDGDGVLEFQLFDGFGYDAPDRIIETTDVKKSNRWSDRDESSFDRPSPWED